MALSDDVKRCERIAAEPGLLGHESKASIRNVLAELARLQGLEDRMREALDERGPIGGKIPMGILDALRVALEGTP